MGDIQTHHAIGEHVFAQMAKVRPEDDYAYVSLGNFLTDVSQVRDPFGYFSAKNTVLWSAIREKLSIPILGPPTAYMLIKDWRKDLLGDIDANKRHGYLAQFLTEFVRFFAHCCFATDSPFHFRGQSLASKEVDRVFDLFFVQYGTQYYPHEHLDFPPYRRGPDHRRSALYQRQRTGLIGYLEEQIQFISEELTKVELQLVSSRDRPTTNGRRDALARLGHILHAVEDYFFHSNFPEVYRWLRLLDLHRQRKTENEIDLQWLLLHGLETAERAVGTVPIRLRRRFARRLRYPVFISEQSQQLFRYKQSPDHSERATDLVYTGGFGPDDVFHTMYGAVRAVEEHLDLFAANARRIKETQLVLYRVLLNEVERRRMAADKKYQSELIQRHSQQLEAGDYKQETANWRAARLITFEGEQALDRAFAIDKELEVKYGRLPGVGGFLISFFSRVQSQADQSARRVKEHDRREESVLEEGTDNGASEEAIGTHSLMAKDSDAKIPLREEALAFAKHASAAVAAVLARRINDNLDPRVGLDWDSILRHYLRFPRTHQDSWEATILRSVYAKNPFPNVVEVADQPQFRLLGAKFGQAKLIERRRGRKATELEERYRRLENLPWTLFQ